MINFFRKIRKKLADKTQENKCQSVLNNESQVHSGSESTFIREEIKEFFRKGKLPSDNHFKDLIDSNLNNIDNGISKSFKKSLNDDTKDFKIRGGKKKQ